MSFCLQTKRQPVKFFGILFCLTLSEQCHEFWLIGQQVVSLIRTRCSMSTVHFGQSPSIPLAFLHTGQKCNSPIGGGGGASSSSEPSFGGRSFSLFCISDAAAVVLVSSSSGSRCSCKNQAFDCWSYFFHWAKLLFFNFVMRLVTWSKISPSSNVHSWSPPKLSHRVSPSMFGKLLVRWTNQEKIAWTKQVS